MKVKLIKTIHFRYNISMTHRTIGSVVKRIISTLRVRPNDLALPQMKTGESLAHVGLILGVYSENDNTLVTHFGHGGPVQLYKVLIPTRGGCHNRQPQQDKSHQG